LPFPGIWSLCGGYKTHSLLKVEGRSGEIWFQFRFKQSQVSGPLESISALECAEGLLHRVSQEAQAPIPLDGRRAERPASAGLLRDAVQELPVCEEIPILSAVL